MPIKTTKGKVMGTFGTYFSQEHEPSEKEIQCVKQLAEFAANVLD